MVTEWMLSDALRLRERPSPAARTGDAAAMAAVSVPAESYKVFVRDLVVAGSIGIYEHERRLKQRVRVNVELVVAGAISGSDDFAEVLNYETIVAGVKAIAGAGHLDLVETFADRVATLCFHDDRVQEARVTVEKLDVYPDAESVGVTVERRRAAPSPR